MSEPLKGNVAIVILAAGQARRMGSDTPHKLLALFDGIPLIRRVAQAATASHAQQVIVVTGSQAEKIGEALSGLPVRIVHNPSYTQGMATSLARGICSARESPPSAAIIMLGDMPFVNASHLDQLISTALAQPEPAIIRATDQGRAGHPVMIPAPLFLQVERLAGDQGAHSVLRDSGLPIIPVEIGRAASHDVDTPEAVRAAGGHLQPLPD